jgi:hypothetical protein
MNKRRIKLAESELRDLYLRQGWSTLQIAEYYQCSVDTITRHFEEFGIPLRSWSQATLNRFGILEKLKDFSGDPREMAYLLGFRIGDLAVKRWSEGSEAVIVDCGTTVQEQVNLIRELFEPYGRVRVKEFVNKNGVRQFDVHCTLNASFEFLLDPARCVPRWILADDELFLFFFAGYVDAEGSFYLHSPISAPYGVFDLLSTDKELLHQCHEKLKALGIRCSKFSLRRRAGLLSRLGKRNRKDVWGFQVAERASLLLLIDQLSPYLRHGKRVSDSRLVKVNVQRRLAELGKGHWRSRSSGIASS